MQLYDGYSLQYIDGVPYLLPFGQNVADQKRGIRINETGAFIWERLKAGRSRDGLLRDLADRFHAAPHETALLRKDLDEFLDQLTLRSFIRDARPGSEMSAHSEQFFACIAGFRVKITAPKGLLEGYFDDFYVPAGPADLTIDVEGGIPSHRENGTVLIRDHQLWVMDMGDEYLFLFPRSKGLVEGRLQKYGARGHIYCLPPYGEPLSSELFQAVRLMFLCFAQRHNMYAIHSASVLYRRKAWLFSGHSGSGKTTHTNMWKELSGAPVINGDLNLLAETPDGPVIRGIPWCGTSGICDARTYPLGGIILLRQDSRDFCEELSAHSKALLTAQRFISPLWTEDMLGNSLSFTEHLSGQILIFRLHCTREPSAYLTAKARIDAFAEQ